jgi:WD40 repeat protein
MRSAVFAMLLAALLVAPARAQLWSVPFPKFDERGHHAESLAFAPNGQCVVSAGYHVSLGGEGGAAELCFRDVKLGTELKSFRGKPGGYAGRAGSMAISPDGKTIAAAGSYAPGVGETVRCWIDLWDVDARKVRVTLPGDEGIICWVSFSPDGKKLLASS